MFDRVAVVALVLGACPCLSIAQEPITYRSAIVALTDDPEPRVRFEETLAAKAREHDYDATTTYGIEPGVDNLDGRRFMRTLAANGIQAVSAGAVWLDEAVESQEQGIERLQDLIVANIDAARPAIRQHLGLPPL